MKRFIIYFLFVFVAGCATAPKAATIRTKLAVDTEQQLNQSSVEVESLIKYVISQKGEIAFFALEKKYLSLISQIKSQYYNDSTQLSEKSAKAGADYIRGQEKIKEGLQNEANRLLLLVLKIKVGAKAVNAINQMSDSEIQLQKEAIGQIEQTALNTAIGGIIAQLVDKYSSTSINGPTTQSVSP